MVIVDRDLCNGCGECARSCLTGTIRLDGSGKAFVDPEGLCIQCGHCISTCQMEALREDWGTGRTGVPGELGCRESDREDWGTGSTGVPGELGCRKGWEDCTGAYDFDITAFLKEKRSTRNFVDKPVERELITEGVTIAQHAPCSANGHKVHWAVLPDKEKVAKYFELCREEFERLGIFPEVEASMTVGKNLVTFSAPAMLFVYADEGAFIPNADCVIAMLYADLFWRNRGMGTCWSAFALEAPNHSEKVRDFLRIPEGRTVYGAVALGYPDEPIYRRIPKRPAPVVDWL